MAGLLYTACTSFTSFTVMLVYCHNQYFDTPTHTVNIKNVCKYAHAYLPGPDINDAYIALSVSDLHILTKRLGDTD